MSSAICLDGMRTGRHPVVRPASRFHCYLDDQPNFLIPSYLGIPACKDPGRLTINPYCWWAGHNSAPPAISEASARLGLTWESEEAIWVADSVRGIWLPFCVGSRYKSILTGLFAGTLSPTALDEQSIQVLQFARILLNPDRDKAAHSQRSAVIAHCAKEYADRGYAVIGDLLHPFHVGALRRYYRYCVRTGLFSLGDGQSPLRYIAHNEVVAQFFHAQLTSMASLIAGEPLKPSYVYFAAYRGGAQLPCHTDRKQCAHSMTLLLDYVPEPERESPWPLQLHTSFGLIPVCQSIGDGLMYRGDIIPHERKKLEENAASTSLFFHYVSEGFSDPLD